MSILTKYFQQQLKRIPPRIVILRLLQYPKNPASQCRTESRFQWDERISFLCHSGGDWIPFFNGVEYQHALNVVKGLLVVH